MASAFNPNHAWNQSPMNFGVQLEQEYEFVGLPGDRQQQQQQQSFASPNLYNYPQQRQLPSSNAAQMPQSSTLQGAFAAPQSSQLSHARTSSYGANHPSHGAMHTGYQQGGYVSQPNSPPANNPVRAPYRTNGASSYNFSGVDPSQSGSDLQTNYVNAPGGNMQDSFPQGSPSGISQQQPTYFNQSGHDGPQPKRHHGQAFNDEQMVEEPEAEVPDQKDNNKAKLSRACARCKALKVRCEAKTETDPCKRCLNGGHECIIPGRKIRRVPPKREHLLSEIKSQAKEIERLMRELEKVTSNSSKRSTDHIDDSITDFSSPVLSPTSASGSYLGTDAHVSEANTSPNPENAATDKAIQDWIAKARESLHDFGNFMEIGGAALPKSYLIEEDPEDTSSDDEDEYADASDEFEGNVNYAVTVERPDGGEGRQYSEGPSSNNLRHKLSASSIATTSTSVLPRKKKDSGDNARPANLPVEASPFGLFGNLSLRNPISRGNSAEPEDADKGSGIANENFFKPTLAPQPLAKKINNAQQQPAILTRGIITPEEAEKLFKIYFDHMNLSCSLLDPVLYTAQRTFHRSPFLFTVICAIASRFYSERPDLYLKCMHYAQLAAGTALIGGVKNVEMCSAYILLSLYPVPAKKWEDQRSWLYLGLAIRTATDLNLHLPTTAKPLNENHAREMLNRTRIWLNCLNLDRSTGSQYGKPPIISPRDYIANHSDDWWKSSPYNMKNFDIYLCAYNAELKVMAAFIAKIYSNPHHPTGLNKEVNFEAIATETDDELLALRDRWFSTIEAHTDFRDLQNRFRAGLIRLAYNYSRLIALSYGFQHAFGKNDSRDENPFLMRCLRAASDVVDALVHKIAVPEQLHFVRHGPEAQSVFVTFASAFLVKLLQPRFSVYLTQEQRIEIRGLVQKVIGVLGSPEVAIDDRHGPKLYARFLEKLLAKPMARIDPLSPGQNSNAPLPRGKSRGARPSPGHIAEHSLSQEYTPQLYNHSSPSTSTTLSPPPTESALSFDNFAPVGPIDPYAPEAMGMNGNGVDNSNSGNAMMTEFFQPPLPFDDHIMQSMQSLTDPSGWQDISLPGFNWMTQFQENLGLDLNNPALLYGEQNMEYMTGSSMNQ